MPKFRLSIRQLFYVVALIAAGLAISPLTLIVSVLILLMWWAVFSTGKKDILLLPWMVFIAIAVWLLMSSTFTIRDGPSGSAYCSNNMRQIMIALYNYHDAHGRLPPAYVADESTGQPMHSWRVLILPYMEEYAIYDQYDFDEPWNGPNNSKLAAQTPYCFSCPLHETDDGQTTYKIISDAGAAFDGTNSRTFSDFGDGVSNSIVLVEDTENPINWMQPDDVDIDAAIKILNEDSKFHHIKEETFRRIIFGSHIGIANGAISSVLPGEIKPEVLRRLMLISNGGFHDVSLDYYMQNSSSGRVQVKYGAYIGLALYIALAVMPWFYFFPTSKLNRRSDQNQPTNVCV